MDRIAIDDRMGVQRYYLGVPCHPCQLSLALLAFVSTLTYSDSSRTFPSFLTFRYASPSTSRALVRKASFSLVGALGALRDGLSTRSHVSLKMESTSSFVPLKSAWSPFSAACSSSRFFSSSDAPDFSASAIWSNTCFSSRAVSNLLVALLNKSMGYMLTRAHCRDAGQANKIKT